MRRGWIGIGALIGIVPLLASMAPRGDRAGDRAGDPDPTAGREDPAGSGDGAGSAGAAGVADDGAVVVAERSAGDRMLDLAIRSPALDGLGHARLLLPPRWSRGARRTWPVLWLLHGGCGMHDKPADWTERTGIGPLTEDADVIVVMPDCGGSGNFTDWWNYGNGGAPRWETFHLVELRQILERGYRAGVSRAVAGNWMGGMGAMAYAARHRGLFRAAASFSAPLHLLHDDPGGLDGRDIVELGTGTGSPGADWRRVWGDPVEQRVVWRQHNPYDLADRLAGVGLYVSAGDGRQGPYDREPGIDVVEALAGMLAGRFAEKLERLGIPAVTHIYQGKRGWPYWERELRSAFPVLLTALTRPPARKTGRV